MAMVDERVIEDAAKAAKDARRAMQLTVFAVIVALVVLAIDHSIKRAIISEAQDVREIFRQFREATDGLTEAIESRASGGAANGSADAGSGGVADDTGKRPAASRDAGGKSGARAGRPGGSRARP